MGITPLYRYQAFGLRIDSEIELADMSVANDGEAQINIRCGDLSQKIIFDQDSTHFQVSDDEFLFHFRDFATFYVGQGSTITVQVCDAADINIVKLLLLGFALGMVLTQRGVLVMHASALELGGRGILLVGPPGAGKSTMAAALCQEGWSFLADDIAAISRNDAGVLQIIPGFPKQKLTPESAAMLGIETAGLSIVPDKNKFVIPMTAAFCSQPVPIKAIYEIICQPGDTVSVEPVTGMKKLECLIENTYVASLLGTSGRKAANLEQCFALAEQAKVFRLTRSIGQATIASQVACLLDNFRSI